MKPTVVKRNFNNLDGEVVQHFDIIPGSAKLTTDPFDAENFYPADGLLTPGSGEMSFSYAIGKNLRKAQKQRQDRRDTRVKSKAEARTTKAKAKAGTADAQKTAAKSLGKESASDVALAKALAKSAPKPVAKKSNTGLIIGISVGVVLLGVGGFLLYRKMKKK